MARWRKIIRKRKRRLQSFRLSSGANLASSRLILRLAKLSFLMVLLIFLASFVLIPIFSFNLPSPDRVIRREGFSTKIVDRYGRSLYDIYEDKKRTPVELKDVPQDLKNATIAIEDKNFYKHQGFDPLGILRGFSRIFTRGYAQGGSTLTQQLVKNVLLSPERTVFRKIKEFILAVQIENKYTKEEILQMYLNEAPYGGTAWGVGAAAETYFGKKVTDLSLVESVILAGLPQRPSVYSPFSTEPDAYVLRTEQVLRRMREDGYITRSQEEEAGAELADFEFAKRESTFKAPHFVQYVQKLLTERYGEEVILGGGLKVTTTLDLTLQEKAQLAVSEEIAKVEAFQITNGAAVIIDPETGEILAMVGSKNFWADNYDGQVNVTLSLRQPGSAIKPITYVSAFEKGYTASTLLMDVETEFPGGENQPAYKPVNYDGKFRGPVQVRYALGNSINVPAVKMLARVGLKETLKTAYDLGITSLEPSLETLSRVGLSLTLGGGEVRLLELTNAYAAFANKGFRVDQIAILKIEDLQGNVLEVNEPKKGKRVLSEEEAFLISHILSDNDARTEVFGTNSQLNISGRTVFVKTGTTNDKRDNWTIGGNSLALVGVWVGNNDNSPMKNVASGVTGASPIWRRILLDTLSEKPNIGLVIPSGIVTAEVDKISGFAAHDGFASRLEYFVKGTEPGEDPVHVKLKVCKTDAKLATPSDIAAGNYDEKEFIVIKEEDPTAALGGPNKWQEAYLAWANLQADQRYHPPNDFCQTGNPVNVEFKNPKDRDSYLPDQFVIKIQADSVNDISEVSLDVDGVRMRKFTELPYEVQASLNNGVHELLAKARDSRGNESERRIKIGINSSWDYSPSPTPTLPPSPTP